MGFVIDLATNKIFIVSLLAIIVAQIFKMIVISVQKRRFKPLSFFEMAGMPSAHTATAIAALTSIYLEQGVTTLFMVAFALTIFLIDILVSVQRSVGVHANIINTMLSLFPGKIKYKPLRISMGHKVKEVIAGGLLGYITAYLLWPIL